MHTILAAHSNFSIGESILSVEGLIDAAKAAGATVVGLTDTMSVTGLIDFTNRAKKAGIKPIIGCRLRFVDDPTWRKTKENKKAPPEYYLTYYVLSEKGLAILFKLLSLANTEERFYFQAKLGFDDLYSALADATAEDVAIASSDVLSVVGHKDAASILARIASLISAANVFLSLTPINTPYWDTLNKKVYGLVADLPGTRLLITRPVFYNKGDASATTVMNAVARNVRMDSLWIHSPAESNFHAFERAEMMTEAKAMVCRLHARGAGSITNLMMATALALKCTDVLADMVKYEWKKAPISLPVMAENEFLTLVAACKSGFAERLGCTAFGHKPTMEELRDVYQPRLVYELGVLKKLKVAGYFLLVQDIVQYAKKNGILVGPGRGSVGGSLVAYLMGITDCDPIRFGLLFERFINPDRIDLPDADLDFMSERRHEIVGYLVAKYGQDRVAGISNFNTLAAASTIRDVSKAFGLEEGDYRCSKLVKKAHGANIDLVDQVKLVPEIADFRDRYKPMWDVCLKVEGSLKSMGRHAAAVVVGGVDLVERAVVERRKDGATINWDKRIVEDQGLVKVDILGLETLDVIDKATKYIRKNRGKEIDLGKIPLDDPKVLDNFAAAKTTGVFQFESGGMRRLLRELGKDGAMRFEDVTAATALYRPGPMESGMMDSYWRRKQGIESVDYDHPLMEPILEPTFGVMVYQEQVMQVSRVIAGYSAPDADKLRKIMGKKLPEEMKKERGKFCDGCVATISCTAEWAGDLFDKIEGFAGYGFNKSHSVEYALISWQAMWLKTNFPVEFYAAALSLMKEEKLPPLLKDAMFFGITVLMPDINHSSGQFEILNDTTLCIPFNRIKGISENTTNAILKAREGGPFKSIADLTARVERRKCNVGHVDKLNRVGAFARIEMQPAANDPCRIKDQRELIPGSVSSSVPIAREFDKEKVTKLELVKIVADYRRENATDGMPVKPTIGKDARFMVISDCPTNGEERIGSMSYGDNFEAVAIAMAEHGLGRSDGYWTALIKRPKEGKQVSSGEITTYEPYLKREIAATKPPIIVLLGSMTVRHFIPDFKGKASDSPGKIIYSAALDANLVVGFNPGEIYHDPDKQTTMNEVFASVAGLL